MEFTEEEQVAFDNIVDGRLSSDEKAELVAMIEEFGSRRFRDGVSAGHG